MNTLFFRQNSHRNVSRLESLPRVKRDARNEGSPANPTGENMQKIREQNKRKKKRKVVRRGWPFFRFSRHFFKMGPTRFT